MKYIKTLLLSLLVCNCAFASYTFDHWKQDYAKRASKRGLPKKFVLKTLKDIELDPEVIEKDKNQVIMSSDVDYKEFIQRWLRESPSRIEKGRAVLKENLKLLTKIEKKYGVEKEAIVALWGTETFYGEITGDYNLVRSLATLAFEGRRRKFFEKQLNATLRLVKNGHVTVEDLKGSWAGATGQCQFMPSNIYAYARDYNGDGKKDIWNTKADIFASIAYFLKKVGWKKGKSIGSLAFNTKNVKLTPEKYRTKAQYTKLGFRDENGNKISSGNWRARMFAPIPLKNSPVVLRGSNYRALLRWNNSSLFAAFNIILMKGIKS